MSLDGEIDQGNADPVLATLREHAERSAGDVVVECSGITFVDSAGLRVFFLLSGELAAEGRSLVLTGLRGTPRRAAELVDLGQVVRLLD